MKNDLSIQPDFWPRAPKHQLYEKGTYIVTAGTLHKEHIWRGTERLKALQIGLLRYARKYRWHLEAWAVFSNHYHFIAQSPEDATDGAKSLTSFLGEFHYRASEYVNQLDHKTGRQAWHNFWETRLTHRTSYIARLNYVHQNAVKHGLVPVANQYPFCSAGWFENTATHAQVKSVYAFKTDRLNVLDEYEPMW